MSSPFDRVVCVATGKGGAFKTSLTANLAGLCAAGEYRVLVVDLDPQGDLQDDLGYFDDSRRDGGKQLAMAMTYGEPLRPVLTDVRPGLDVIPGGEYLFGVAGELLTRSTRGKSTSDLLATAMEPLLAAGDYDLVFIDTPPTDEALQTLALRASRWLLAPTRSDSSSIRAVARVAAIAGNLRAEGHQVDLLGVVLAGIEVSATRVREDASADLNVMLEDVAPVFDGIIRHSSAVARQGRKSGLLAHELAQQVEGAEPWWASLRAGTSRPNLPGTAPALAAEYVDVAEQMLARINDLEGATV